MAGKLGLGHLETLLEGLNDRSIDLTDTELANVAAATFAETVDVTGLTSLDGGHLSTVVLSGGGTTVLTAANSGATCIFDTAATSQFTLPAPQLGMRFTFISAIINSADHVIYGGAAGAGFLGGVAMVSTTADETNAFAAAVDGENDFITLNATTSGGVAAGSIIHVVAILGAAAAKTWAVHGTLLASGAMITPFGDAQL